MGTLVLTYCKRADLHAGDRTTLITRGGRRFIVKMEHGPNIFYEPTPGFVKDYAVTISKADQLVYKTGLCKRCYEVEEQSTEIIRQCGGRPE